MPEILRMPASKARQIERLLAITMTIADLSGRAKVLAEVEEAIGLKARPRTGLSFGAVDPGTVDPGTVDPLIRDPLIGDAELFEFGEFSRNTPTQRTAPVLSGIGEAVSSRKRTGTAGEPAVAAGREAVATDRVSAPALLGRDVPPDGTVLRGAGCLHGAPPFFARAGSTDQRINRSTDQPINGSRVLSFADAIVLVPSRIEPKEALEFFRQKLAMTKVAFDKLLKRYRDIAFTVARVESVALIESIQQILAEIIAEGQTRAEFRRRVDQAMKSAGVAPLNVFHLETVFQNNVNSAYQAGRMSQMLQADVRRALPWWQYHTAGDNRVRRNHAALLGFIARFDDPVWNRVAPPNGHRCRCSLTALTEAHARRLAKARGIDLDVAGSARIPRGGGPDKGWSHSAAAGLRARLAA